MKTTKKATVASERWPCSAPSSPACKTGRTSALTNIRLAWVLRWGFAAWASFSPTSHAAPGDLDPSFGGTGIVATNLSSDYDRGFAMAMHGDGKVVVAGQSFRGGFFQFAVARYSTDGKLDPTFGDAGIVTSSIGTGGATAYGVALDQDGRIVVVGTCVGGIALARFHTTGAPDLSLNGSGNLILPFDTGIGNGAAVAIDGDNRIVIAGRSRSGSIDRILVARFLATGSADLSFNSSGYIITSVGGVVDEALCVAVQPTGEIVVAGTASSDFVVLRYTSTGSLDPSFNTAGYRTLDFAGEADAANSLAIDGGGRIVVAGYATVSGKRRFAVARFTALGQLDFTFNNGVGKATTSILDTEDIGRTVALQSGGRILVAGFAKNATKQFYDIAFARYDANGNLDSQFDGDGKLTLSLTNRDDMGHAVHVRNDDTIWLAGATRPVGNDDILLLSLNADGSPNTAFAPEGKVITDIPKPGIDVVTSIALQSDGRIVAAGYRSNGTDTDFAVARYHPDGTLDTSFNETGVVRCSFGDRTSDFGYGVAIQADGKIVVAGTSGGDVTMVRLLPSGAPDVTFGTNVPYYGSGKIVSLGLGVAEGRGLRILPNGKILVAGHVNRNYAVVRYTEDGLLDTQFGNGGLAFTDFTGREDYGHAVALQSNGTIIVTGRYEELGYTNCGIAAFSATGTPLWKTIPFGVSSPGANSVGGYGVAVQPLDDKPVIVGLNSIGNFFLMRLTAGGAQDFSFDTDGIVETPIGVGEDYGKGLAIETGGKFVSVGHSYNGNTGRDDFAIVRHLPNGALDTGFRTTGKVTTSIGSGNSRATCVAIQEDGRILVAGESETANGADFTIARYFGTEQPPMAQTVAATEVGKTSATLRAVVNPNSLATTAYFEYGPTTAYGNTTSIQSMGNGFTDLNISAAITLLTPNTTYHYRIVGVNGAALNSGISYGADTTFTTNPDPPLAFTGQPISVSATGATLVGVVVPNGRVTDAWFEWGLSPQYGSTTAVQVVPNVNNVVDVFAPLAGLIPDATYHYRIVASNSGSPNPTLGDNVTFQARPPAPVAVTGDAFSLSTTSARVNGSVRARNASTQVFFDYGTDGSTFPSSVAATPALVTGDLETAVSADLANLAQGVTYYYRLRAVNAGGPAEGDVVTFALDSLSGLVQGTPAAVALSDRQGFMFVSLLPAGLPGAGWRFAGEQQWRASGVPAGGLTTSDRVVEFRPVPGYETPSAEFVTIVSGGAATFLTREYQPLGGGAGTGSMTITIKPDMLTVLTNPVTERAQWRLLGEDDNQWRESGATLPALVAGSYLVEFKPLPAVAPARTTPTPITVNVVESEVAAATAIYFLAPSQSGAVPAVVSFDTVSAGGDLPYQYVGQLRSDVSSGSGFVVRPRVVATAAHVVFDDSTLTNATGLQWLFQRDKGLYEPEPRTPRGFHLFTSYAAQRAAEGTPGESSPTSQNLDAAAVYFLEDAGRGGFSGYMASDSIQNEWLTSSALKTLVGYPTDPAAGILPSNEGRMHATPPAAAALTRLHEFTYGTTSLRGGGGMSGGPLCVRSGEGSYYPAAIFLGGTGQTIVRAIDSGVIELFNLADVSSSGGDDQGDGGFSLTYNSLGIGTSRLTVNIVPSAAQWVYGGDTFNSGATRQGIVTPSAAVSFTSVPGYLTPAPVNISLSDSTHPAPNAVTYNKNYNGIKTHPANRLNVVAFSSTSFAVSVAGTPLASTGYRWRRNGVNLSDGTTAAGTSVSGATARTLNLSNVRAADAGSYSVVVTWANGSVTSNAATLSVQPAPQSIAFPPIADRLLSAGSFVLNATASSSLPVSYQVTGGVATLSGSNAVTPIAPGIVTIRARQDGSADYAPATPFDRSFQITAETLATWRAQYFTAVELGDAAISGPDADVGRDGVNVLLAYALNLNPKASDSRMMVPGTGTFGLPIMRLEQVSGQPCLTGEFVRRRAETQPGITYHMEFSGGLSAGAVWAPATSTLGVPTVIDATWERVKMLDPHPDDAPRFGRLRVTAP